MLSLKDLHVSVDDKEILRGINLEVDEGETHAIMGPNGSGKSTLSYVLSGRDGYEVTKGQILFKGDDVADMEPHERAAAGIYLAFQYPMEIPGVSNLTFLKTAVNAVRQARGIDELDAITFLKYAREKGELLEMSDELLKRPVNVGFSGGEKKRNEIFQMAMLEPTLAILDETDSGLDIDALRVVSEGVNRLRSAERSMIIITHYQRLLDHIIPDFVHILAKGRFVASGGKQLAIELEKDGYARFGIDGDESEAA
ncbi:MAG: Fe-S cluster assembly ATPase SufC [Pseudomonadota bacterium]|nr:Fe-S cluster assembly ATPase SufC [Pseudomonadota bacterium]